MAKTPLRTRIWRRCARTLGLALTVALCVTFESSVKQACPAQEVSGENHSAPATNPSKDEPKAAPTSAEVATWVEQLRHDSYTVRQASADRLLATGIVAREPLVAVVDGPDPELRAAARRLLALIERSEFQRRLSEFAADTDGKQGLTLPGWEQYRELVGDDTESRALFVEMQRCEAPLLADVFDGGSVRGESLWNERLIRLLQWPGAGGARRSPPPLGSCMAMFFLATVPEGELTNQAAGYLPRLIQQPPVLSAVKGQTRHEAVRRVIVAWILNCPSHDEFMLQQRLSAAIDHELTEALPLALNVAIGGEGYATVRPQVRAGAILAVGRLGGADDAAKLEPLLEDTSVCLPPQAPVPPGQAAPAVQVRDVALVVMLQLTKQNPADYGYIHAQRQPQRLYDARTLYVNSDEQRAVAIEKWRAWKAAQSRTVEPAAN